MTVILSILLGENKRKVLLAGKVCVPSTPTILDALGPVAVHVNVIK